MKFYFKILKNYLKKPINPKKVALLLERKSFEVEELTKDFIKVDILPNRFGDSANFFGFAKELNSLLGLGLKKLDLSFSQSLKEKPLVKMRVKDFYTLRIAKDIKNGESPEWLKRIIELYDYKPINFLVDLANFIMLELGTPVHIFDLDKIKPPIQVRFAKKGEKFIGLNSKEFSLEDSDLVIADSLGPIALAGILGSERAKVDLTTKNIAIEIASFNPQFIYKTQRRLKLFTEAGFRFERTVPISRVMLASQRICHFLDGKIGQLFVSKKPKEQTFPIILTLKSVKDLGLEISEKKIEKILKSLYFDFEKEKDYYLVRKDPDRIDINSPEDVLDEIVRFYGYENVRETLPKTNLKISHSRIYSFSDLLRNILTSLGFDEVINYSLVGKQEIDFLKNEGFVFQEIEILNPPRPEFSFVRPFLFLGLMKAAALNLGFLENVNIFEIGKAYSFLKGKVKEENKIAILSASRKRQPFRKQEFLNFKGKLETFLHKISPEIKVEKDIRISNLNIGFLKTYKDVFNISGDVFIAEISIDKLMKIQREILFKEIPKYPAILRDISFYMLEPFSYEKIKEIIFLKSPLIEDIEILDVYEKDNLLSYTLRIIFRSKERTLKEEEVDKVLEEIKKELSKLPLRLRS